MGRRSEKGTGLCCRLPAFVFGESLEQAWLSPAFLSFFALRIPILECAVLRCSRQHVMRTSFLFVVLALSSINQSVWLSIRCFSSKLPCLPCQGSLGVVRYYKEIFSWWQGWGGGCLVAPPRCITQVGAVVLDGNLCPYQEV